MTNNNSKDSSIAHAMKELENDIRELMHMSDIAAESFDELGGRLSRDKDSQTFRFTNHELDQFGFLVNNVANRASKLNKRFQSAYRGEVEE